MTLNNNSVYVQSHSDKAAPKPLQSVMELLEKLDCEFLKHRWSRNGVPHVVLQFRSQTHSVCYFGRDSFYRIFHPYGEDCPQEHHDCKTPQEVVEFIESR